MRQPSGETSNKLDGLVVVPANRVVSVVAPYKTGLLMLLQHEGAERLNVRFCQNFGLFSLLGLY